MRLPAPCPPDSITPYCRRACSRIGISVRSAAPECGRGIVAHAQKGQPPRSAETLLWPQHAEIEPPFVGFKRHAPDGRNAVDERECFVRFRDGANPGKVIYCSRRGLAVDHRDQLD